MFVKLNISVHLFKIITMMLSLIFLGMIGGPQIILIIAVVLLLFGGRKIPELMKGLGSGIKEFKNATKEEEAKPQVEEEKKS
jgi:sec-independent protein translocase protein TatA